MNKIERIQLKAEMILEIINSYEWNYQSMLDKVQVYTDKIISLGDGPENASEVKYYQSELDRVNARIQIYKEIIAYLEKMF